MNNYAGKTILLVEDEPVILLIQSSILKKNGFNVKTAISGKKAIELVLPGENIDLILMDIDLGDGMDGTEAADVILKERDIPVLFLSSHTEPEIVEKTEVITNYGYVVKNSGETVLLASIKMAFRLHEERMKVKIQSEKLKALNEELEASNEELNAAFEELEAANEELIESQNEILKSEEKYRRLFTSNNDGICIHEVIYDDGNAADYRILDVNPVYEAVTGLKRKDVQNKKGSEIYGVGYPPYIDIYASVAETEVPAAFTTFFEPMGRHFFISVFSPGKGLFATVFKDITERKEIENRLTESESRYRSLFENNQSVMLIIDPSDGSIVDANDAAVKYYGWSRHELKSMNINQINTMGPDEIKREMDKVRSSHKNIFNFRHRHSDGSISYVESYSGLIIIREKEYLYSIIHDVSDRIKAETELIKVIEEKDALLRELQHRVKNNLAMISGLIGLESIRSGDDKVTAVLKNLRNRISALERLYSSLYHTGNVAEIRLDTYISEITDSITKTYISEVQNIRIITDLEPIVVSIKQAASIGLITNELLVNALKYAFPDGMDGVITITLKTSGSGYELAITDNGAGLPEGFDIKNSTGSGVMIIDMLAEHMEGAFTALTGEFTIFRITVPVAG